jgi:hypothetical protein
MVPGGLLLNCSNRLTAVDFHLHLNFIVKSDTPPVSLQVEAFTTLATCKVLTPCLTLLHPTVIHDEPGRFRSVACFGLL